MGTYLTDSERRLLKIREVTDIDCLFPGAVFKFMRGKGKFKNDSFIFTKSETHIFTTKYYFIDRLTLGKRVSDKVEYKRMTDVKTERPDTGNPVMFLNICTPDEERKLNFEVSNYLREEYNEFYGEQRPMELVKKIYEPMELNAIYNEDCVETMTERMKENSIHLTVTSPPYDDARDYGRHTTWFTKIIKELYRITKPGGIVVWVVADVSRDFSETGTSFKQALSFMDAGFKLFDTMIYEKPPRGATGNNLGYWQAFEYMFVFSKGKPATINLIEDRKNIESRAGDTGTKRLKSNIRKQVKRAGYGEYGRRTNIWKYFVGKGHSTKDELAFEHSAIFPEKLAEDHILSWSNPGDIVYDCFSGSGTTGKMAILNKRKFVGSEINFEYFNNSLKRINETAGKINGIKPQIK